MVLSLLIGNGNKQLFELNKQELQERLIGLHKASAATATKLVKIFIKLYIIIQQIRISRRIF